VIFRHLFARLEGGAGSTSVEPVSTVEGLIVLTSDTYTDLANGGGTNGDTDGTAASYTGSSPRRTALSASKEKDDFDDDNYKYNDNNSNATTTTSLSGVNTANMSGGGWWGWWADDNTTTVGGGMAGTEATESQEEGDVSLAEVKLDPL